MSAYLARLKDDRQLVGLFVVDDESELFWLIDECCDPGAVEIALLGSGGIYWGKSINFRVPITEEASEAPDYDGLPSGTSISEQWGQTFYADDADIQWMDVPLAADED